MLYSVLSDGEGAAFIRLGEEVLLSGTCKTGLLNSEQQPSLLLRWDTRCQILWQCCLRSMYVQLINCSVDFRLSGSFNRKKQIFPIWFKYMINWMIILGLNGDNIYYVYDNIFSNVSKN